MEKNIVEYWMHKGEITEKVADYISVKNFAKAIEALYRECLEDYENSEDIEEYLADFEGFNIQSLAWDFTMKANRETKKYLHMQNHRMDGNFANIEEDYPAHITGTYWSSEYAGDDYFRLFPQMVARLDAAEDSKQADEDRAYLMDWYFEAFGTFGIKYKFQDTLSEIAGVLEQQSVTA